MNILVVDDNKGTRMGIALSLKQAKYMVQEAKDGTTALLKASMQRFDLAIIDLMLPDMDGLTVYKKMREGSSRIRFFIITAHPYSPKAEEAKKLGLEVMEKPFGMEEIVGKVGEILGVEQGTDSMVE